jgi:hypothetical protein
LKLEQNALILENSGDIAHLLSCLRYWNSRWIPPKSKYTPSLLEIFPPEIIKALDDAWLEQTKKECV